MELELKNPIVKLTNIIIDKKGGYRERNIKKYARHYVTKQWDKEHKIIRVTSSRLESCEVDIQTGRITG